MKKIVIFAFQGEMICFSHAMLNTIDLKEQGFEVKLIIEGAATGLIGKLVHKDNPFNNLYQKIIKDGLLAGVCRVCAGKTESLFEAEKQNLTLVDEMYGHPAFSTWIKSGYEIISM